MMLVNTFGWRVAILAQMLTYVLRILRGFCSLVFCLCRLMDYQPAQGQPTQGDCRAQRARDPLGDVLPLDYFKWQKLCKYAAVGDCRHGDMCTYIHSLSMPDGRVVRDCRPKKCHCKYPHIIPICHGWSKGFCTLGRRTQIGVQAGDFYRGKGVHRITREQPIC